MAKPIKVKMKLEIEAGKATPAPPIGPAVSPHGVNIQDFCTRFNDMTKDRMGDIVPCILTIFDDRTFSIELKTSPVAAMIKKAINLKKGSATPNTNKVGKITKAQVKEIAEYKLQDLNTRKLDSAIKIVEGTAKSLGIEITE